jgi:hypothetical protein
MYFPYLRGRQFELICLRELLQKKLIGENILPVIEPVKLSSTLIRTINEFSENNQKLAIILNPDVGSFSSEFRGAENHEQKDKFLKAIDSHSIIKSLIINNECVRNLKYWLGNGIKKEELLVVNSNKEYFDIYNSEFSDTKPLFILIPDESFYRREVSGNKILLKDSFNKKDRNSDYVNNPDEFFSDDHLYYHQENYVGFSDYSIVGNNYFESGFSPYAVVIHIVYFDIADKIRIRHFVSDSNEDISNPAKKFYEAVGKLNSWIETTHISSRTFGITELLKHYRDETYPGLGTIKKLTIMHHIEMISNFLNERGKK